MRDENEGEPGSNRGAKRRAHRAKRSNPSFSAQYPEVFVVKSFRGLFYKKQHKGFLSTQRR
jgi:hypothetical protein